MINMKLIKVQSNKHVKNFKIYMHKRINTQGIYQRRGLRHRDLIVLQHVNYMSSSFTIRFKIVLIIFIRKLHMILCHGETCAFKV